MKYLGTITDPKDLTTKKYVDDSVGGVQTSLNTLSGRVDTNEDNIAMAESDIEGLQGDVGTLKTNMTAAQTAITTLQDTYVPNTTKVNGKALSADITLTATDVGALSSDYKPTFYVNATVNASDTTTTLDKTPEQIYAAYNEGKDVYCIVNAGAHLILPLVIAGGVIGGDLVFKSSFSQGISNSPVDFQQITLELLFSSSTKSVWKIARTILPTKTSQLTNDSGFLTLDTLPKYTGGVS